MAGVARRVAKYAALPKFAAAAGLVAGGLMIAGCTSTLSNLPSQVGGEPAGTPERGATPVAYPAVHDMPPPRTTAVLTDAQRKRAEDDLAAIRDRQNKRAGTPANDD